MESFAEEVCRCHAPAHGQHPFLPGGRTPAGTAERLATNTKCIWREINGGIFLRILHFSPEVTFVVHLAETLMIQNTIYLVDMWHNAKLELISVPSYFLNGVRGGYYPAFDKTPHLIRNLGLAPRQGKCPNSVYK